MRKRLETAGLHCALLLGGGLTAVVPDALAALPKWNYSASASETFTDNAGADGTSDSESDQITKVSLSVALVHKGARISSSLRLSGEARDFARESSRDNSRLLGSGLARAELVEQRLFLDVSGSISEEHTSAFGKTSADGTIDIDNRSIVRRYSTGLRAPIRVGNSVQGNADLRMDWTSGGKVTNGTRINKTLHIGLGDSSAWGDLGWNFAVTRSQLGGSALANEADSSTARISLIYSYTDNLAFRLIGGRESNDFDDGARQSAYTRGAGATLRLSPRTSIDSEIERRFFGTGYNFTVRHSRPLSSIQIRYSRDVTSIDGTGLVSIEELAYRELFVSLESSIPDDAERERVARGLAALVPDGSTTFVSFLTNSFSVSRRLSVTGSLVGARNTLTIGLSAGENERIGSGGGLDTGDDFTRFSRVKTTSISSTLSHRITGNTNLIVSASANRSEGGGESNQEVMRRSMSVGYNTKVGPHTNGAVSVRRQRSTGSTDYTESALILSLTARF
ncbi:MAG: TIGR03016 family PEP-CTERM system-associated outer membrane protein [Rhodocyclaceae bacterium]|nr:TIGR03016 family PEP-CTERM system-associated outer membrane protein [Rhodocyclaceae bacterium]